MFLLAWGVDGLALSSAAKMPVDDRSGSLVEALKDHLSQNKYPAWAEDLDWTRLRKFYRTRRHTPVWIDGRGPLLRAVQWRDVLVTADQDGLEPREYHSPVIRYLWRSRRTITRARLELLLTDAFFRYSGEVGSGYQYPRVVDIDWYIDPPKVDPVKLLRRVAQKNDIEVLLHDLPPPHAAYRRLREVLQQYRRFAAIGEWPSLLRGPVLKLGTWHDQIALLRERLIWEGLLNEEEAVDENLFDVAVDDAVRRFQQRYGHKVDGMVGRATRQSLNVSLARRIEDIKGNMERWRWLPRDLGERYVIVNMAGYKLFVIEHDKTTLDMRVIIGKPYKATPAFKDALTYLEFNPTWNVPPRIAREDILPKLRANHNFLAANKIRVFESWRSGAKELDPAKIAWSNISDGHFPYKLQQDPGRTNSMGRIKFMFPNKFDVYLHDTPAIHLFNEHIRTFSSGCIRVARPVSLAAQLLRSEPGWSKKDITVAIKSGKTQRVQITKPIPIYLLYWTAWVEDDGSIHFRKDVYNRNQNIAIGLSEAGSLPGLGLAQK